MSTGNGNQPQALQVYEPPQRDSSITPFIPQSIQEGLKYAEILASGSAIAIPDYLRGKSADVFAIMARGLEMNIPPLRALNSFYLVKGKIGMYADAMIAQCRRYPKICPYFRVVEQTNERATWETHRTGDAQPTKSTFTIKDADVAGLLSSDMYRKWPKQMLLWRAGVFLARAVYSDLVGGILSVDELETMPENYVSPPIAETTRPDLKVEPDPAATATANEVTEIQGLIRAAANKEALMELVPRIKKLTPDAQAMLKTSYAQRTAELKKAAVPPPPPPADDDFPAVSEREPGDDDMGAA